MPRVLWKTIYRVLTLKDHVSRLYPYKKWQLLTKRGLDISNHVWNCSKMNGDRLKIFFERSHRWSIWSLHMNSEESWLQMEFSFNEVRQQTISWFHAYIAQKNEKIKLFCSKIDHLFLMIIRTHYYWIMKHCDWIAESIWV